MGRKYGIVSSGRCLFRKQKGSPNGLLNLHKKVTFYLRALEPDGNGCTGEISASPRKVPNKQDRFNLVF